MTEKVADLKELRSLQESISKETDKSTKGKKVITVHMGTCGIASGAEDIRAEIKRQLSIKKIEDVVLRESGCIGFCSREPMITIEDGKERSIIYQGLDKEKVKTIIQKHISEGNIVDELDPIIEKSKLNDFYEYQKPVVLRNKGRIDPFSIQDYIKHDGYQALAKALKVKDPQELINMLLKSGLRGRGGAGFPTGKKWQFCLNAVAEDGIKYVVCNGDEGDPGAFMDRNLLESDPHSVLEGMVIAGKAIGALKGYIYVRAEYPLAIKTLKKALKDAKSMSLIGKDILGSGFDFDIEIYQGAGAFVCGEETALLSSIEGKRGFPIPKPPFPANKGLFGKPTLINNVETFANVAQIILNGPNWFSCIGTEGSKGTKIFALTGAVNNVGLVEVPMGITLRDIVYKIGGGIKDDRQFKAVQIGGPSGGCIPEAFLDTPIDYEKVKTAGAIMGSGGMIVLDDTICMVDLARFFMDFIQEESCGQCVPCRIGTKRMLEILQRITDGKGEKGDIEKLEELGAMIKEASLCGLGKTAPNPVLSTIHYFREEYEEHIETQLSCKRLHRKKEKVKKI